MADGFLVPLQGNNLPNNGIRRQLQRIKALVNTQQAAGDPLEIVDLPVALTHQRRNGINRRQALIDLPLDQLPLIGGQADGFIAQSFVAHHFGETDHRATDQQHREEQKPRLHPHPAE